jgi:hypothetical protein
VAGHPRVGWRAKAFRRRRVARSSVGA